MANNIICISVTLILLIESAAVKGICEEQLPALSKVSPHGVCASFVQPRGYMCEEHQVITEDGYILSLLRVSRGWSEDKKVKKNTVFLQHGIFMDATSWLIDSTNEPLAFILADNGFDVWLGNNRGTTYSRGHTKLSPNDMAYWEWSWDELSNYDLSASVQYAYNQAGGNLHFVGHSLGTTTALVAFSQGKLVDIVRSVALLGPIAYVSHPGSLLLRICAELSLANIVYEQGLREFIPNGEVVNTILKVICNIRAINCSNILSLLTGPNCCIDPSVINIYLDHEPQATSTKNLVHLTQGFKTGKIAKYDYGDIRQNMEHYGQIYPPIYDMKNISKELPLFLCHGGNDFLADATDVQVLLDDLKDHDKDKFLVLFRENYSHLDLISGINAREMVYEPMMAFLKLH